MSRVFLLSFTSALDQLADGSLKDEELNTAIFCFGCRDIFFDDTNKDILAIQRPYQKKNVTVEHVEKIRVALKAAEKDNRVVWRRHHNTGADRNGSEVHGEISKILARLNLFQLNPNLPPIIENGFLETAIKRVDRHNAVRVVL